MADIAYLHHVHDSDGDSKDPDQTLTLDSLPYWSHHDFVEFPPLDSDQSLHLNISTIHHHDHLCSPSPQSSSIVHIQDEAVSEPDSTLGPRENQVNFVMDLFQQRVEQSQVIGRSDLVSEALNGSDFGIIDGNGDVGIMEDLELDLGLGLGFGSESHENCGFVTEYCCDEDDDNVFFVGRRGSGSESGEASSTVGCMAPFANSVRVGGFDSDSDEAENEVLGNDLHSGDGRGLDLVHEDSDDDAVIPLCWDSFQLEDHRETNEDFEWEEVDGRVDEREVFRTFLHADDDEGSVSVSVTPLIAAEEEVNVERVGGLGNLEWEVLLNIDNLERNPGLEHDIEPYYGEHDDYIYTVEYEMLFGQFSENENALVGCPPASKTVVQKLPSVVLTQEDLDNNNALCAICKDEINVGEKAKQLPCSHHYHGYCIMPWLGIRNTCPVCRYQLPTDDADYERRRTLRASRGM